jgi:DNA-directed RNA polymerase specialized sigma subunit
MAEPSPLEIYESGLARITDACTDPWFTERLAEYRAGDEAAWRRISGSCLGRVLAIAKRHWRPDSPVTLLDAVQEGNVALVNAIKRFSGNTADEFLRQMNAAVERRVILFLQHPDFDWRFDPPQLDASARV